MSEIKNPYSKRSRLRKLRGETAFVSTHHAGLHMDTLMALGWSLRSIAGESGISPQTVARIYRGDQHTALPATVKAILDVDPETIAKRTARRVRGKEAEPFVSRVGTVRRIQALLYMGWRHQDLRAHCGLNTPDLLHQRGRWVVRSTHDRVAAMYRALSHKRGPSERTAIRAARLGYVGPAEWNDIDRDQGPEPEEEAV